jgi:hypothetical protein
MSTEVVAPLECHPWFERYRGMIVRWLDDPQGYPAFEVPVLPVVRWMDDLSPTAVGLSAVMLTKKKAVGLAPYVGRPFVYLWFVGVDQYGRQVAGNSRIVYTQKIDRLTP